MFLTCVKKNGMQRRLYKVEKKKMPHLIDYESRCHNRSQHCRYNTLVIRLETVAIKYTTEYFIPISILKFNVKKTPY